MCSPQGPVPTRGCGVHTPLSPPFLSYSSEARKAPVHQVVPVVEVSGKCESGRLPGLGSSSGRSHTGAGWTACEQSTALHVPNLFCCENVHTLEFAHTKVTRLFHATPQSSCSLGSRHMPARFPADSGTDCKQLRTRDYTRPFGGPGVRKIHSVYMYFHTSLLFPNILLEGRVTPHPDEISRYPDNY